MQPNLKCKIKEMEQVLLTGCIPHTRQNTGGITQQVNNIGSHIDE